METPTMPMPELPFVPDHSTEEVAVDVLEQAVEENETLMRSKDSRPVIRVTRNQLLQLVDNNAGRGIATVYYTCDTRAAKGGRAGRPVNPYPLPIRKAASMSFAMGASYESCVRRQQDREGLMPDFESGGFVNGAERINEYWIRQVNGNVCLSIIPFRGGASRYFDAEGNERTKDEIAPWLPKDEKPGTQDTEKHVRFRALSLRNIKYLIFRGCVFEVID